MDGGGDEASAAAAITAAPAVAEEEGRPVCAIEEMDAQEVPAGAAAVRPPATAEGGGVGKAVAPAKELVLGLAQPPALLLPPPPLSFCWACAVRAWPWRGTVSTCTGCEAERLLPPVAEDRAGLPSVHGCHCCMLMLRRGLKVPPASAIKRGGSSPAATSSFVKQSASSAAGSAKGQGQAGESARLSKAHVLLRVATAMCKQAAAGPHFHCERAPRQNARPHVRTDNVSRVSPLPHMRAKAVTHGAERTKFVEVQAVGVGAGQASQEGVAVLGGAKAGTHGLATPHRAL